MLAMLHDLAICRSPVVCIELATVRMGLVEQEDWLQGVDAVKWSAEDMQRPEVKEALELDGKLQTSMALTSDDQRRPRWLGAIAIRSADRGIKALQGLNSSAVLFICTWIVWSTQLCMTCCSGGLGGD